MSKSEEELVSSTGGELGRIAKEVSREARNSPIPVFIAILAAVLALVSMADGDANERSMQAHIEASNQFAYFQAKNIRMTDSQIANAILTTTGNTELAAEWKAKAERYKSEKVEILKAAKIEQKKQYVAQRQGDYFAVAVSLLQIAIVLASASLIVHGGLLLTGSVILSVAAVFFTVNGYGLYFDFSTDPAEIGKAAMTYFGILSP